MKFLPWMNTTKFFKFQNIEDLQKYDYVVYPILLQMRSYGLVLMVFKIVMTG
jgi:hypothetical protein